MSDMKCPSCGQELKQDYYDCKMLECQNPKCKHYYDSCIGREELWQELTRTRKALDVARSALIRVGADKIMFSDEYNIIINALKQIDQITALTKGGSNE